MVRASRSTGRVGGAVESVSRREWIEGRRGRVGPRPLVRTAGAPSEKALVGFRWAVGRGIAGVCRAGCRLAGWPVAGVRRVPTAQHPKMSLGLRRVGGMPAPGPLALGRGVVVLAAGRSRRRGRGRRWWSIDEAVLADPGPDRGRACTRRGLAAAARGGGAGRRPGRVPRARGVAGRAVDARPRASSPGSTACTSWCGPTPTTPAPGEPSLVVGGARPPASAPRHARGPGRRRPCPTAPRRGSTAARAPPAGRRRRPTAHAVVPPRVGRARPAHACCPARGAHRRPRPRPAGRGRPRRRPGPHHRPGRLGQDPGAHRAAPPPPRRPRPTSPRPSLAVAYNVKARDEMEERHHRRSRPRVQTLNGLGLWAAAPRPGAARRRCSTSARSAASSTAWSPVRRRRANTDPDRPLPRGPRRSASACATRPRSRPSATTSPASPTMFGPYRGELRAPAARVDFDEQVYGAVEALLPDGAFRRRAQAAVPPPPGRRVPGPHPGPRAAAAPARRSRPSTCSAWATTTR